jgi:hypothetical protein
MSSGRSLVAVVNDSLEADVCLAEYIDRLNVTTIHGTEDDCDYPKETHPNRPIRREKMGWPGDFQRAVVTFGRFERSPFSRFRAPWIESWTFVVGLYARETVAADDGIRSSGDLWVLDMYDIIVRILGWSQVNELGCGEFDPILIARRSHVGNVTDLTFLDDRRAWHLATRFRWAVVSRGLVAPVPNCCA